MKKFLLYLFVFQVIATVSQAQDQHFTQFYAAPLTLNPALTGSMDAKYRLNMIYRDQWRNILDDPSTTFAAALDLRFRVKFNNKNSKDAAGIGLLFFNDKNPGTDFNTNQIALSGAFHKSLNSRNNQFLSLGLQAALAQRNVNYENLTFNDQFNGTNAYDGASGEILPPNNFAFGDYSVGLNYAYAPKGKTALFAGFALHHFLEPQMSFYFDKDDPESIGNSTLFMKYSGQLSFQIPIGNRFQIAPRALYATQGPHQELNAGSNFKIVVNDIDGTSLHIGAWARTVGYEDDTYNLDALIFMAGFEYGNFLLGLSYDASFNGLTISNTGISRSALEISITYLGEYDNDAILCPKF